MTGHDRKFRLAARLLSRILELDESDQLDVLACALNGWFYAWEKKGRLPS